MTNNMTHKKLHKIFCSERNIVVRNNVCYTKLHTRSKLTLSTAIIKYSYTTQVTLFKEQFV